MFFELVLFGLTAGFVAGFFGLGGGTILTPILVVAGFSMKEAISISIMQMVFSSIYGSYLNSKKAKEVFKEGIILGIGGSLGGLMNSFVHSLVSNLFLQYLFIFIVLLSIIKIFVSPAEPKVAVKQHNKVVLILVGFIVGVIAMSIGVGGAIMLIPLLVGVMKYPLKTATSLSLFFVIFSSLAGFFSLTVTGQMLFYEGSIIGIASLIGVFFGIKIKNRTGAKNYKKSILIMNTLILGIMVYKTI
ncbi:sulfite exporter TauE/SafE family protein [Halarcobacter ebronensis]|uniref:Probable membrane transporter protein n=1 Tax=Halarcobacter ebronensis TaxID=1462615 RepID=A0A4Q1ATZ6_9BACT|nr:sulfite exporter TauE/SafE family protein [Halarcobacter ebronensis]QKF82298.1 sulfite exporter TauE/SafE family protein [Halarcobacter ebronensis]RXK07670.1 hypothetical protein CRV07_04200 [Halarcobacter ebronensis]